MVAGLLLWVQIHKLSFSLGHVAKFPVYYKRVEWSSPYLAFRVCPCTLLQVEHVGSLLIVVLHFEYVEQVNVPYKIQCTESSQWIPLK